MEDKSPSCININRGLDSCTYVTLKKGNKDDIMLNLGLASKNGEAVDETPTPTRLIRNCEEVGLFQDLQNVNPFDEYFKKAVENKDYSLSVPDTRELTDDSLHTPQIYPQPEEQINKISSKSTDKFDLSLSIIDDTTNESDDALIIINSDDEDDHLTKLDLNEDINNLKNTKENLREKVKNAIFQKAQGLKTVPLQQLQQPKKGRPTYRSPNLTPEEYGRREANRWSQMRSRVKKRKQWDDMQAEIKELKVERDKLINMNVILEEKVRRLEARLKDYVSSKQPLTNNDEGIPVHVIQRLPQAQDSKVRNIAIASQSAVPVLHTSSKDIIQFVEEPTLQPTTIVNNHSEPIHIIQPHSPTLQPTTIVNNHSKPIHIIQPHSSSLPIMTTKQTSIRILDNTQVVPQNNPNNAVLVIMPPQNSRSVAPLSFKRDLNSSFARKLKVKR